MDRFVFKIQKSRPPENESSEAAQSSSQSQPRSDSESEHSQSVEMIKNTQRQGKDSDSDLNSAADELEHLEPRAKRKKMYKQKFKYEWKTKFKWLDENKNGSPFCKVCHIALKGGLTHFVRHEKATYHKTNMTTAQNTPKISDFSKNAENNRTEQSVKRAEFKLIGFLHEHNLPFLLMDHLILLLASIFPDSKIAKGLKCGRTKSKIITQSCMAAEQISNITNILQTQPFSLIIDETTDVSTQKSLVLVARYFDNSQKRCRDIFIGLLRVKDCAAQSLFNSICNYFEKLNIPMNNLLGFAADNAAVMMGNIAGVQALFKNILPNIFVLGCVCHSFHLCSSAAAKKLPRSLEDFIRMVYNYFAHSSKRQESMQEFQTFVNLKPHKLLHPSQTRWLSLQAAVDRILENWDALTLYFRAQCFEEDLNSNRTILTSFEHPTVKMYFTFLSFILDVINKLNLEFQSEKSKLYNLIIKVSDLYRSILRNYIKKDYMDKNNLKDIQHSNPTYFLPIETIYLGAKTDILITSGNVDKAELHNLKLRCLEFYIELAGQIKKRFDFSDSVLNFLNILNPKVAVSGKVSSIVSKAQTYFPHLIDDIEKLNTQWRLLSDTTTLKTLDLSDPEAFWSEVFNMKNNLDEYMFSALKILIEGLLSLPHSSAAAERKFSQVTLLKTKLRNRLEIDTLDSILQVKELLNNCECHKWEPSTSLLKRKLEY